VANYNAASPDPTTQPLLRPGSLPSTYWREELFRIDQVVSDKFKVSFRYIHDSWDTTVLTPQWSYLSITHPRRRRSHRSERFFGPGTSLVARLTNTISPALLNDFVASYVNSSITLRDENGPGGAVFQRNPTLDQPLVQDPSAPGQCNPVLSADPATGFPQCAIGYIFNNGFGGKMPGVEFLGTNAAYGGRGLRSTLLHAVGTHNPTYSARDDIGKALGSTRCNSEHNMCTRSAIRITTRLRGFGDTQGLLTYNNLAHSTGNALRLPGGEADSAGNPTGFIQSFTQDSAKHRYYQRYQIASRISKMTGRSCTTSR